MSPTIRNGRGERIVVDLTPDRAPPPGPVERVVAARPVLPCDGCAHAPVCSIRAAVDVAGLEVFAPPSPHPALRFAVRVEVSCEFFLAGGEGAAGSSLTDVARRWHEDRRQSSENGTRRSIEVRKERTRWTPEMRAAQSARVKASIAARKAEAGEA